MLPTVSIVVVNYNGLRHLEDCFSSLTHLDYPSENLELILVDNASTDGSAEYLETHYPQVRIVQNQDNIGFGAGNNLGARVAVGQYVVFLNNDMRADSQFVRELVRTIQSDPRIVCVSAKILDWAGQRFDFAGAAAHFAGYAYQVGVGQRFDPEQFTEVKPILFACGGAMMMERQCFLEVGGFDGDYFAFYEDLDLGWRLWLLGHQVVFAPDAIVRHRHHGTAGNFAGYRKQVLYKRNALYTVLKNYSDENLGRILPAVLLANVAGVVERTTQLGHLNPDDYFIKSIKQSGLTTALDRQSMSTLIAMHEVVDHLPQVMAKRRFIQEHRRRSDAEIADLFQRPFGHWPDVNARTQYSLADAFGIQSLFEHLPRRVLVISSDILPYPGLPTVGSGLRAWGIGQGLKSRGHEVSFSMPRAALAGRETMVPPEVRELAWEHSTLAAVVLKAQPDIVVVCNWPVMALLPTELLGVPVVLDQHGPHYLEREYQKAGTADENTQYKLAALRKADFFTCAGTKQLAYFQAWLEQAGWTEQERREQAAAIPVSLSPDLPDRQPDAELTFVYGGVFLPWQDPSIALSALVQALDERGQGKLYFYGGKHPVYPVATGIFEPLLEQLKHSPHVIAPGMVSHDDLIRRYTRSHVAVDAMRRNPERELAFTTRTVEYLWCGLPVLYHDYAELSEYIREYEAGWVVAPEDREAIEAVLHTIFEHPEQITERSRNAQRLVREKLTWDRTITPLDTFVRHPRMRPHDFSVRSAANQNVRYLLSMAQTVYQQGGARTLWKEGWAYLKRRVSF